MTSKDVKRLILVLATKPRIGMRAVLDMGIRGSTLIQLAALVSVVTGIAGYVATLIAPVVEGAVAPTPLGYVFVAATNIFMSSFLFFWAGRAMDGVGSLRDVAMAMIVHQGFMLLLPLWIAVLTMISPSLSSLAIITGLPYAIFLMAGFLAEAHKLRSIGTAVLLIVGVLFVLSFVLIFFISLFGIAPA